MRAAWSIREETRRDGAGSRPPVVVSDSERAATPAERTGAGRASVVDELRDEGALARAAAVAGRDAVTDAGLVVTGSDDAPTEGVLYDPASDGPLGRWIQRERCRAFVTEELEDEDGHVTTLRRRCKQKAVKAGTHCVWHGGRSGIMGPSAARRLEQYRIALLEELAPPALMRLAELVLSDDEKVALSAANSILDRVGLSAVRKIADVTEEERKRTGDSTDTAISELFARRVAAIEAAVRDEREELEE